MKIRKSRRSWTDEQLIEAVKVSVSIADVIRYLNLAVRPGNYTTINKYIKLLNLNTSHFTGQSWVGTSKGVPFKQDLKDILVENSTYATSHLRKRLIDEGLKAHKCEGCKLTEWMGVPIPLQTDHINGRNKDHRLENLRLLCPNCHALTDTWCGRKRVK